MFDDESGLMLVKKAEESASKFVRDGSDSSGNCGGRGILENGGESSRVSPWIESKLAFSSSSVGRQVTKEGRERSERSLMRIMARWRIFGEGKESG